MIIWFLWFSLSNTNLLQIGGGHFKDKHVVMIQDLIVIIDKMINDKKEIIIDTQDGLSTITSFNSGAKENDILEVYNYFDGNLPSDYLTLLSHYDGFVLFKYKDVGGMNFFDCKELIKVNSLQRENYSGEWDDSVALISTSLGDGDFIGIRTLEGSYQILDCFLEEASADWRCIETSLEDLVGNLIKYEAEKYWLTS